MRFTVGQFLQSFKVSEWLQNYLVYQLLFLMLYYLQTAENMLYPILLVINNNIQLLAVVYTLVGHL